MSIRQCHHTVRVLVDQKLVMCCHDDGGTNAVYGLKK